MYGCYNFLCGHHSPPPENISKLLYSPFFFPLLVKMETELIIINACITIFSIGMLIVSLLSYNKYKNSKLLFVSIVFLIFFIKGLIFSFGLFYNNINNIFSNTYIALFDLLILILLFMATLKR